MNEEILSLNEIQNGLKDMRLYLVAKRIGVSYPTLKKLSEGKDLNYTSKTLKTVSKYICNWPSF